MKNLISLLSIAFFLPFSLQAQNNKYVIEGTIGHLSAPAKIYLDHYKNKINRWDSVVLNDGHFRFQGEYDPDEQTVLKFFPLGTVGKKPLHRVREIYIEPGIITISSTDTLATLHYLNSPINTDYQQLENASLILVKKWQKSSSLLNSATPDQKVSGELLAKVTNDSAQYYQGTKKMYFTLIKKYPSSPISLAIVKNYGASFQNEVAAEPLFNLLSPKVRESYGGKEYANKIIAAKLISLGKQAPDFTLPDTSGELVSLTDFKGKYVLVDFWASWCVFCRAENPNVLAAYNIYKDKGFTVLSVSLDLPGQKKAWLKAVHQDHLPWTQVSDLKGWKSAPVKLFGIESIPQNFLLDPQGKVIARNLREQALQNKLKAVFAKN
ncbi:MAG: AhpC/TSA family protein [Bacteroidota bacterium]|nr:AhpC/TSA family protein [Bacteroidota bacterium]